MKYKIFIEFCATGILGILIGFVLDPSLCISGGIFALILVIGVRVILLLNEILNKIDGK